MEGSRTGAAGVLLPAVETGQLQQALGIGRKDAPFVVEV
jgi:hypothetical protein